MPIHACSPPQACSNTFAVYLRQIKHHLHDGLAHHPKNQNPKNKIPWNFHLDIKPLIFTSHPYYFQNVKPVTQSNQVQAWMTACSQNKTHGHAPREAMQIEKPFWQENLIVTQRHFRQQDDPRVAASARFRGNDAPMERASRRDRRNNAGNDASEILPPEAALSGRNADRYDFRRRATFDARPESRCADRLSEPYWGMNIMCSHQSASACDTPKPLPPVFHYSPNYHTRSRGAACVPSLTFRPRRPDPRATSRVLAAGIDRANHQPAGRPRQ
jgi:hypothetical protein